MNPSDDVLTHKKKAAYAGIEGLYAGGPAGIYAVAALRELARNPNFRLREPERGMLQELHLVGPHDEVDQHTLEIVLAFIVGEGACMRVEPML